MARKRRHKETESSDDVSLSNSKIKTRKEETKEDNSRTRPTRRNVSEESTPNTRTRSAQKNNTASPKKAERRKSGAHSIQAERRKSGAHSIQAERRKSGAHSIQAVLPSRSLRNNSVDTTKNKTAIQRKSSEKLMSPSHENNISPKDPKDKIFPQKKKPGRKAKQTPVEQDTKEGSEQQTTLKSDTEVIQSCSASDTNTSFVSGSQQEESLSDSSVTLIQDQGRRSSGRMRKLTHKAAAAQDTSRVQSKPSSPRKKGSNVQELLLENQDPPANNTEYPAVNGHSSICDVTYGKSLVTCDETSSISDTTECVSSSNNYTVTQELDQSTNVLSHKKTDNVIADTDSNSKRSNSESLSSPYIVVSQIESNIQIHTITPVSHSQQPVRKHHNDNLSSNQVDANVQKSLQDGNDETTQADSNSSQTSAKDSPIQDLTLYGGRQETEKVRADAEVQVSLMQNRREMVSTGTQVDDDLQLPWQQPRLETEQGGTVDLLPPEPQQTPGSSSKPSSVDLNTMLTMPESDEKVLGGVSALIKDSLMQIRGMRQFIIHDLPSLTHVACFQTADKMAISGTIQGISRAWSILSNIEHNVHNKDPKSKKSVKIQWTGKNGVMRTVEFKKTPESEKSATVTPALPNKVVTVFVDIKSPEDAVNHENVVEVTPLREDGPSPLKQKHSSENLENSTTTENASASKKQISLLSGRSYSMSHIKMEGQIGVPASSNSDQKNKGSKEKGSDVDLGKTPCTITVADDGLSTEDIVIAEFNFGSNYNKACTENNVKAKKEHLERNKSTVVRSGSKKNTSSDGGTQTQNDISDDDNNGYDDDGDDDSAIWQGKDVDNEVITVTKNGEFLCEQCPQVFTSRSDLIAHRLQAHEKVNTLETAPSFVECTTCSQRFRCRLELHRHERRAHSLVSLLPKANMVSFTCNVCDKKFSEKRYLTTHLKRHTGIKRHCCPICGWRFFEAHKLKFHLETHKSEEDRQLPYRCTICQRQYHNRQSWNDHMNTHSGSKPYMCSVCGTGFAHRIGLHRHKLTHEKECQHKCPYCSRGFKVKANLRAHLTIHTGIGKHSCTICKKVFTVATSLRRHKCQPPETKQEWKVDETSECPYMFMCGVCNMTFPTLAEAETHSLTHMDETAADMSLVGVQVEEVGDESNVLNPDTNDASTTYIIESDNSMKTMVISSVQNPGDGEALVDEVEKIQIAASTLADLSTLSKDAESCLPGKEQTVTANAVSISKQDVSGKETQIVTASSSTTSEQDIACVSEKEQIVTASGSTASEQDVDCIPGKETQMVTAIGSTTSEQDVACNPGKETQVVTASGSMTSEQDVACIPGKEMQMVTAIGSTTSEQDVACNPGKETQILTASSSTTSEQDVACIPGKETQILTASSSTTSEQDVACNPGKETQILTASGSMTSEQDVACIPGKEKQMVTASGSTTSEQDVACIPGNDTQISSASGLPRSEQDLGERTQATAVIDKVIGGTSTDKSDVSQDSDKSPDEQTHDKSIGDSADTVTST